MGEQRYDEYDAGVKTELPLEKDPWRCVSCNKASVCRPGTLCQSCAQKEGYVCIHCLTPEESNHARGTLLTHGTCGRCGTNWAEDKILLECGTKGPPASEEDKPMSEGNLASRAKARMLGIVGQLKREAAQPVGTSLREIIEDLKGYAEEVAEQLEQLHAAVLARNVQLEEVRAQLKEAEETVQAREDVIKSLRAEGDELRGNLEQVKLARLNTTERRMESEKQRAQLDKQLDEAVEELKQERDLHAMTSKRYKALRENYDHVVKVNKRLQEELEKRGCLVVGKEPGGIFAAEKPEDSPTHHHNWQVLYDDEGRPTGRSICSCGAEWVQTEEGSALPAPIPLCNTQPPPPSISEQSGAVKSFVTCREGPEKGAHAFSFQSWPGSCGYGTVTYLVCSWCGEVREIRKESAEEDVGSIDRSALEFAWNWLRSTRGWGAGDVADAGQALVKAGVKIREDK